MGKIYFIADSHASYLLYANRHGINRDTYRALSSVARYIVEDNADEKTVVFCGDNLDSKSPSPSDIKALQEAVSLLTAASINVYGIEGNHDKVAAKVMSENYTNFKWIDLIDGMESINHKMIDINGTTIYGLDYTQGKQIYEELEAIPECDILVLHQPFIHVSPFEANTLEVEGVPDQVRKAVVFGHVHISDKRQTSKDVWVVSPGATHAQKLTHPHGAFAVYDTKDNTFDFVQTPEHRLMRRFICKHESDIAEIEEELSSFESEDDNLKPIIGIKFVESLGKDIYKLAEKYKDKIHYFPKVIPNENEQLVMEEVQDLSTEDILSKLFDSIELDRKGVDKDTYENALSIIEGHPDKVFAYIKKLEEQRDEINKTKAS